MLVGISQPTFMPWIGYFALLDKVQKFIFLDDVQFEKRSWQQRNHINLDNRKYLLSISVKSKGKFNQKISEVEILYNKDFELIKKKLYYAYNKTRYFKNYYQDICNIIDKKFIFLSELNVELIKYFAKSLDIKVDYDFSSKYFLNFKKENLIFELCKISKCTQYLSTIGSKNYLQDHKFVPGTNIKISFFQYNDVQYNQKGNKFIPKLSILDLIFNEGRNSINIIRGGIHIN